MNKTGGLHVYITCLYNMVYFLYLNCEKVDLTQLTINSSLVMLRYKTSVHSCIYTIENGDQAW